MLISCRSLSLRLTVSLTNKEEQMLQQTLTIDEAAKLLSISPRSLADRRYRLRLGLAARKIGKRVVFLEGDLLRILERGREYLPSEGRR